jgi:putative phosphoribosyl transferase
MLRFQDRTEAGVLLAERLARYANQSNVVVLALPRGGVPVGFEVAKALRVPLDVFVVRKLGAPGQPELAMGAIASGGVRLLNLEMVERLNIPRDMIEAVSRKEREELKRRERAYRGDGPPFDFSNQIVILVDDGLATGSTMLAAIAALRQTHPARIVVAIPVASRETCAEIETEVDEIVCLLTPASFHSVGLWYEDFAQTTDQEVRNLLEAARTGDFSLVEQA